MNVKNIKFVFFQIETVGALPDLVVVFLVVIISLVLAVFIYSIIKCTSCFGLMEENSRWEARVTSQEVTSMSREYDSTTSKDKNSHSPNAGKSRKGSSSNKKVVKKGKSNPSSKSSSKTPSPVLPPKPRSSLMMKKMTEYRKSLVSNTTTNIELVKESLSSRHRRSKSEGAKILNEKTKTSSSKSTSTFTTSNLSDVSIRNSKALKHGPKIKKSSSSIGLVRDVEHNAISGKRNDINEEK